MGDADINIATEIVKDTFFRQKKVVIPHYRLPDRDDVFKKAAEFILAHGYNPEMFVIAQFHLKPVNEKMAMLPQYLYSSESIDNFGLLVDTISSIVPYETIYKENIARLKSQMNFGFDEDEVLRSLTLNFDPCFRLTYSALPIPKLMNNDELRKAAKERFNPEIKAVLEKYKHDYRRITTWIENK